MTMAHELDCVGSKWADNCPVNGFIVKFGLGAIVTDYLSIPLH